MIKKVHILDADMMKKRSLRANPEKTMNDQSGAQEKVEKTGR